MRGRAPPESVQQCTHCGDCAMRMHARVTRDVADDAAPPRGGGALFAHSLACSVNAAAVLMVVAKRRNARKAGDPPGDKSPSAPATHHADLEAASLWLRLVRLR